MLSLVPEYKTACMTRQRSVAMDTLPILRYYWQPLAIIDLGSLLFTVLYTQLHF